MNEQNQVDSLKDVIETPFKDVQYLSHLLITEGAKFGWSLLSAIITLVVGFWLTGKIKKIIEKRMIARDVDLSIRSFLIPIINIILKLIIIIFVVGRLGLNASGFIASLAGVGVAIGLALQGSLSNFAAGILIILFKPFKVGDYIVSQGNEGSVESISILNTVIVTVKGQVVTLPNANLFNNPITNFSTKEFRRLDLNIGISYEDDFDKAQKIILDILDKSEYIEDSQPKVVEIFEFGESSVNLTVRCFVRGSNYLAANWQLNRSIKYSFDESNISMPYPHREVIMKNEEKEEKQANEVN